jgi:hypothetical protein
LRKIFTAINNNTFFFATITQNPKINIYSHLSKVASAVHVQRTKTTSKTAKEMLSLETASEADAIWRRFLLRSLPCQD